MNDGVYNLIVLSQEQSAICNERRKREGEREGEREREREKERGVKASHIES